MPSFLAEKFPKTLTEFHDAGVKNLNYLETMDKCDSIFYTINVTNKQAQNIETGTQNQALFSSCVFFFRQRRTDGSIS